MNNSRKIDIQQTEALIIDFDGVMTNDRVIVDENGIESVICNRQDGLAVQVLKKLKVNTFILSTETNPVVQARGDKLKIEVFQGSGDKKNSLLEICKVHALNLNKTIYIGNDLNDYHAMKCCGIKVCPADSHADIIQIADHVLNKKGGEGVLRELTEQLMGLNLLEYL